MNDQVQGEYITKEGYKQLENELRELKNVKRREVAERILQAKELGDLSENAEYVEAKNEQGFIEGRIMELESLLRNAILIKENAGGDTVSVGSKVYVKIASKKMRFEIVGSSEANPTEGKISNESPLGMAFLGKKVGETVTLTTPRGETAYTILSIK